MYVGAFSLPFSSTVVPPPSASATLCAVPCSCEPLTASVLSALTLPAATFVSVVPFSPFSVTLSFATLSYDTASGFIPPSTSLIAFVSCSTFTASVLALPCATFDNVTGPVDFPPPSVTEL